jgi:CRP/FNR family cyclic AMP-dependent transcriptional regulator
MAEISLFRTDKDAVDVGDGTVLFQQGDPGDVMFAVVNGNVQLSRNGKVVADVGAGEIVGEMALIDSGPRSATATVIGSARVVRVQEHPTFALQVMRVMAERLRVTDDVAH